MCAGFIAKGLARATFGRLVIRWWLNKVWKERLCGANPSQVAGKDIV
jgi:hypothetical protein